MTEDYATLCPVCESPGFRPLFSLAGIPTLSCALWPADKDARDCPRGDVALSGCGACGYIANVAFDPKLIEYDATYENALHFSGVFRDYARREVESLIGRHNLRGKDIVEIGCGDGQFLSLLCQLGDNRGTGYDPSFAPDDHAPPLHPGVRIETRYYTEADAKQHPDLIVCRQVLEHIPDPKSFMRTLRQGLGDHSGTMLSFEVPNAQYIFRDLSVWDLIYEHCTHFNEPALTRLFELADFKVHEVREGFGGLNLTIEASPRGDSEPGQAADLAGKIAEVRAQIEAFGAKASAKIARMSAQLKDWKAEGRRIALWGAGARSTMFMNMVEAADAVGAVVDINPRKHGFNVPGTGREIQDPGQLTAFAPEVVLLMNPIYRDEVGDSLRKLGVNADIICP